MLAGKVMDPLELIDEFLLIPNAETNCAQKQFQTPAADYRNMIIPLPFFESTVSSHLMRFRTRAV